MADPPYNHLGLFPQCENRVAAFITEYKAPHKLPLGYIYEGLDDMELDDVIRCRETDTSRERFRQLMAAVIIQAFSYMVKIGLEYGCVSTGEAFVFLRVPDDPRTVHYFLFVPKGDADAGFHPSGAEDAASEPEVAGRGRAQLNSWEVVYDDLLDTIPLEDASSSEYRPPRHDEFLRMSPVRLRRRPAQTGSPSCWQPQDQRDPSDEEPDPDTPSRQRPLPQDPSRSQATAGSPSSRKSHQGNQSGQYCTQKCPLGLVERGPLDTSCPNVRDHGGSCHRIDLPTSLFSFANNSQKDLDTNCKPVGVPGACGVLFLVRLRSHGYTVAAKSTPIDFVHRLKREAAIYEHLRPVQGIYVPVYLGNIDLETPYFYEGIAELVHMMFLSFGGELISKHLTTENRPYIAQLIDCSARAVHEHGVLHRDLMPRNMLWNEETGQVMVIDFERAELVKRRTVLGAISANRKRKRRSDATMAKLAGDRSSVFARERQRAAIELRGLP
ncbi:hypothetical protein GGR58DRAFT_509396 [Xylaria digitata]|nr:hypothetical protein GGR58DRAFT_509396 [Xylaria digitata]